MTTFITQPVSDGEMIVKIKHNVTKKDFEKSLKDSEDLIIVCEVLLSKEGVKELYNELKKVVENE
jgi:hypothetical protein